jgi:hypothetical protein
MDTFISQVFREIILSLENPTLSTSVFVKKGGKISSGHHGPQVDMAPTGLLITRTVSNLREGSDSHWE